MSGEWVTIADAPPDFTQQDELKRIDRANDKEKQMLQQQQQKEKEGEGEVSTKEKYRYSFWFCHPRCGFKVDRRDVGAIQKHEERCGWCIERREARAKAAQSEADGRDYMRGAITKLERGIDDVLTAKRTIREIQRTSSQEHLQRLYKQDRRFHSNPDQIKYLQLDVDNGMSDVESAQKLITNLLGDKSDPIKRAAAKSMWDRYQSLSPKQRRRGMYK